MATRSPSRQDYHRPTVGGSTNCGQGLDLVCDLPHQIDVLAGEAELLWSLLRDEIMTLIGNG